MASVTAILRSVDDPATETAPDEDWNAPPYNSDDFRMYSLKVELCQKAYQHNIAACPYAHHGERAVRRDVRVQPYEAVVCQELLQKGKCPREDNCKAAHSVFEYWLHPSRYRTQLCREGSSCTRKVCFFAHTLAELRATPASADGSNNTGPIDPFSCGGKYSLAALNKKQQQAEGGQSTTGGKGGNAPAAAAGQQQPAASAASTRPRRNSADNSSAAAKPQGQARSRRSSSEAAAPPAAAAAAWCHNAATACTASAGHPASMAPGACGVLPPCTSFNIQATSGISGLPLQAPMQVVQQHLLLPVMAGELRPAHCGNSIASLSSQLNTYSNSSIGSSSSNSLSPQLLQQVSLDSCFGVGSPATTPAGQQLMMLLGNQAAACNGSSPRPLQQSSSNLADQLLGCSEPLPWACDLSPRQAAGQLRTLSPQQQVLQVLLQATTDAGLGGGGSPVAHQMGACSPQLLSNALATLNMGSPGPPPAVPGVSCAPACQVQLLMPYDTAAPQQQLQQQQQQQRYVVVPQASPSSYGAQASAMEACMLAQQQQQQMFGPASSCLPVNASLLHDASCAASSSSRLSAGLMGQQMGPSLSAGFVSLPPAGMFDEQRQLMACSTPRMPLAVTAWM